MNDNTETNEAYQDRMTKLAHKVSIVLEGVNVEESAVICARLTGFAIGQIPRLHRIKVAEIAMNVLRHAIKDGENAVKEEEEDQPR